MRFSDGIALLTALVWLPVASCGQVNARDVMPVTVEASSFNDSSLLDGGCYSDGCEPALTQDGLGWDAEQSRWSCTATADVACYITYTLNTAREVPEVEIFFSLMTEEFSVIVSTLNADTGEYEAQLIEDVEYSSYSQQAQINANLQPAPTTTSVRIEADIATGDTVNIVETYVILTAEDGEVSKTTSYNWIWWLVFIIALCCCGGFIYSKFCEGYQYGGANAAAAASSSSSASNATTINNIVPQAIQPYANGAAPPPPVYAYPA